MGNGHAHCQLNGGQNGKKNEDEGGDPYMRKNARFKDQIKAELMMFAKLKINFQNRILK